MQVNKFFEAIERYPCILGFGLSEPKPIRRIYLKYEVSSDTKDCIRSFFKDEEVIFEVYHKVDRKAS